MGNLTPRRIFVTGVNGHIGNHIVRDLLEHGYAVRGSVRDLNDPSKTDHVQTHAADLGAEDRLELVEGDVLEADGWTERLEGCDGLFHTATIYSTRGPASEIIDTATMGTAHLLKAAASVGIKRVVYTSSTAAIGNKPKGVVKDEAVWNEDASLPYTTAKTRSERLAWELAEEHDLDLRVINPTAVLGGVGWYGLSERAERQQHTQPYDQTSQRSSAISRRSTSGAWKSGEPDPATSTPSAISSAVPRSAILPTVMSAPIRMLAGLRSRCTIGGSCACR